MTGTSCTWASLPWGQAGLVITEATHVSPEGRITPKCLGLYSDENEPLTEAG